MLELPLLRPWGVEVVLGDTRGRFDHRRRLQSPFPRAGLFSRRSTALMQAEASTEDEGANPRGCPANDSRKGVAPSKPGILLQRLHARYEDTTPHTNAPLRWTTRAAIMGGSDARNDRRTYIYQYAKGKGRAIQRRGRQQHFRVCMWIQEEEGRAKHHAPRLKRRRRRSWGQVGWEGLGFFLLYCHIIHRITYLLLLILHHHLPPNRGLVGP